MYRKMKKEIKSLEEIKAVLLEKKVELEAKFDLKELGVFGSCVRDEQKPESDIDILVDFKDGIGFFKFIELEEYLAELLDNKVDLVSRGALKPFIGQAILKEVELI